MGLCHLEAHILTQESQSGNNFSAFYGKCRGKDLYLLTSALIYITGCKPFALYILSEEFAFFYNTESIADLCISCSQQKKECKVQKVHFQLYVAEGSSSSGVRYSFLGSSHLTSVTVERTFCIPFCSGLQDFFELQVVPFSAIRETSTLVTAVGLLPMHTKKEAFEILLAYESFSYFSVWIVSSSNLEGISNGWVIKEWATMLPCAYRCSGMSYPLLPPPDLQLLQKISNMKRHCV